MNVTLWKPFRELERFFDEDFAPHAVADKTITPKLHVEEDDQYLYVQAEVPGMEEKDIKVSVEKDVLSISGERKNEKKEEKKGFYYSEISFGKFERRVQLPDYVNSENAQAEYKRGVLQIKLAKNPKKGPQMIEVKNAQ